ncbi:MAG: hypothetical protein ACR2MU_03620 [Gaiellaceae bacterium]
MDAEKQVESVTSGRDPGTPFKLQAGVFVIVGLIALVVIGIVSIAYFVA